MKTAATRGFTLVELLAAITSASVVALTAGIMLYHVHRARPYNQAMIDAQQDSSVAMAWLARAMRDGTNVTLLPQDAEELRIDTTGGVRTFFVDAGSRQLWYTSEDGNSVNVTTSRVADEPWAFAHSNVESGVGVRLVLETGEEPEEQEVELETVFFLRNR